MMTGDKCEVLPRLFLLIFGLDFVVEVDFFFWKIADLDGRWWNEAAVLWLTFEIALVAGSKRRKILIKFNKSNV